MLHQSDSKSTTGMQPGSTFVVQRKPYFCRERILDTSRDSTSKCRLAVRGGSNEEKKDYALGMNLMRSQVLYWAAQGLRGIKFTSACPIVPPISSSLQCISAIVLQVSTFLDDVLQGYDCVHMQYLHYSFSHCPLATVLCSPRSCSIERLQLGSCRLCQVVMRCHQISSAFICLRAVHGDCAWKAAPPAQHPS